MQSSRETRILNGFCILLILASGIARLLGLHFQVFSHNSFICLFYTAATLIWARQLQKRLLQENVRKNLVATAFLLIFWMAIRTLKYEYSVFIIMDRYIWYLYYIPLTFIPLLMFLSVLHIGKRQDRTISRKWNLLYIPATLLSLGILTNDLHQLAFRFEGAFAEWMDHDFIRGPLGYAAMSWVVVLSLAILGVVFTRCAVPGRRKKIWVPMIPILIGAAYTLVDISGQKNIVTIMLKMPEVGCFCLAAFMECLIAVRLFPSNDGYSDFWNASSIGAGIMDKDGIIRYRSEKSLFADPEQIREAEHHAVLLRNDTVALRSHAIRGGYGYWTKDLAEINRLNRRLADLGDVIAEENAMLDAENKIKENRTRIEQQSRLYDSIAESVRPQLDKLNDLLTHPPEEETTFEKTMQYACILNCYVKRRSNLLLLFHQTKQIPSGELQLAISESTDYLRRYGVKADARFSGEAMLPGETILTAYELLETAIEAAVPGADAILISVAVSPTGLTLSIELNAPREFLTQNCMDSQLTAQRGTLRMETEQKTEYISLFLPSGGARP